MSASKSHSSELTHPAQILLQLKEAFLDELITRCDDMELLILALDDKDDAENNYNELYRMVHSLKGTAGTHGVPVISVICHHLEDHLNGVEKDFNINEEYINVCLEYIDLIKNARDESMKEVATYETIEKKLDRIRQNLMNNKRVGLIVESSPLMVKLCQNALSKLPVQTIVVNNGLHALQRLMQERFDFMVTGYALDMLNGVALISALKASESVNRDIKIIMSTSKKQLKFPVGVKPDYLLHKGATFADELYADCNKLLAELSTPKKAAAG